MATSSQSAGLSMLDDFSLESLDPSVTLTGKIDVVVTLLWPYSSSTSKLSALVAEDDFKLRKSRGQLKITFLGNAASKLKDVQIGNRLKISLEGARWEKPEQSVSANIPWELTWETRLQIQVKMRFSGLPMEAIADV